MTTCGLHHRAGNESVDVFLAILGMNRVVKFMKYGRLFVALFARFPFFSTSSIQSSIWLSPPVAFPFRMIGLTWPLSKMGPLPPLGIATGLLLMVRDLPSFRLQQFELDF